jgi:hypothetical protein
MHAAISYLEQSLSVLANNAPIHRSEGNIDQATSEEHDAAEIRQAIALLQCAFC